MIINFWLQVLPGSDLMAFWKRAWRKKHLGLLWLQTVNNSQMVPKPTKRMVPKMEIILLNSSSVTIRERLSFVKKFSLIIESHSDLFSTHLLKKFRRIVSIRVPTETGSAYNNFSWQNFVVKCCQKWNKTEKTSETLYLFVELPMWWFTGYSEQKSIFCNNFPNHNQHLSTLAAYDYIV